MDLLRLPNSKISEPTELGLTFRREERFLFPSGIRTKFSVVVNLLRYPGSIQGLSKKNLNDLNLVYFTY